MSLLPQYETGFTLLADNCLIKFLARDAEGGPCRLSDNRLTKEQGAGQFRPH